MWSTGALVTWACAIGRTWTLRGAAVITWTWEHSASGMIDGQERLIVFNTSKQTVDILTTELVHLLSFGTFEQGERGVTRISSIAVAPSGSGEIWLVDTRDCCLQVWTAHGQFVRTVPLSMPERTAPEPTRPSALRWVAGLFGRRDDDDEHKLIPATVAFMQTGEIVVGGVGGWQILRPNGERRYFSHLISPLGKVKALTVGRDDQVYLSAGGGGEIHLPFNQQRRFLQPRHRDRADPNYDFRLFFPSIYFPTALCVTPDDQAIICTGLGYKGSPSGFAIYSMHDGEVLWHSEHNFEGRGVTVTRDGRIFITDNWSVIIQL